MIIKEYMINETTIGIFELPTWLVILAAVLVVAFYVAFYVLRSLGIYKLAKNNGINNAFMAFIPGVWLYPACKLISEARFFRTTIGRVALVFTIIFSIAIIGKFIINVILYVPLAIFYFKGAIIRISPQKSIAGYTRYILDGVFVSNDIYYDVYKYTFVFVLALIDNIVSLFDWVGAVIAIFVYFALFRKFTPANHVLFAILSAFGLFAPFVFAIRNKKPVDYNAFVRSRMGYGNYGNPYNQGGQNTQYTANQTPPPDPFSDFDGKEENSTNNKSDDPFDDFN